MKIKWGRYVISSSCESLPKNHVRIDIHGTIGFDFDHCIVIDARLVPYAFHAGPFSQDMVSREKSVQGTTLSGKRLIPLDAKAIEQAIDCANERVRSNIAEELADAFEEKRDGEVGNCFLLKEDTMWKKLFEHLTPSETDLCDEMHWNGVHYEKTVFPHIWTMYVYRSCQKQPL